MTETNIITRELDSPQPAEVDSCGCSVVPEKIEAPMKAECPVSGTSSKKVPIETLENLIVQEKEHLILEDIQYYYCSEPDCPVIYFSNPARHRSGGEEAPVFEKSDISVKVFSKDSGEDVNACYCFDWTRKRITDQIKTTGNSTAFDEIKEEVKAGRCECERKNPKGDCCLRDISRFTAEIMNSITQ